MVPFASDSRLSKTSPFEVFEEALDAEEAGGTTLRACVSDLDTEVPGATLGAALFACEGVLEAVDLATLLGAALLTSDAATVLALLAFVADDTTVGAFEFVVDLVILTTLLGVLATFSLFASARSAL